MGSDENQQPNAPLPAPGWYPNPSGAKGKLWWTGTEWTQGPPPVVTKQIGLKKVLIICGALLAVVFVISLFQGGDDKAKEDTASDGTTQTQVSGGVTQTFDVPAPTAAAPAPTVDPEEVRRDVEQMAIENAFLKTINDNGIYIEDERAVTVANAACLVILDHPEWGPARVAAEIQAVEPSLTMQEGAYFAGAATKAYCPEEFDRLFGEG